MEKTIFYEYIRTVTKNNLSFTKTVIEIYDGTDNWQVEFITSLSGNGDCNLFKNKYHVFTFKKPTKIKVDKKTAIDAIKHYLYGMD